MQRNIVTFVHKDFKDIIITQLYKIRFEHRSLFVEVQKFQFTSRGKREHRTEIEQNRTHLISLCTSLSRSLLYRWRFRGNRGVASVRASDAHVMRTPSVQLRLRALSPDRGKKAVG